MADNENILTRLGKLFQTNIIIRKDESGQLKIKDVDMTQQSLTSNFVDRYSRLMNNTSTSYGNRENSRNAYDVARQELFRDYEVMDSDSIISSALDVYSDESCVTNVNNEILKIKSDNPKVTKILHNLFFNILNIDFNLWSWIRNLTKYGDFFLQLDILDKHGVVNVRPLSPYSVFRLENHDSSNPNLVQFEIQDSTKNNKPFGKPDANLKENYEIAHFRMLSDTNFIPYGKSMLEGARKVFKQLTLMEDAMLIHRIMRAPEKRIFKVDIGNIPPNEVENFMNKIINKMKKTPVIDQKTGDYNLRYNVESVTEDYYLPVRGGDSGTTIDTLPGLTNDNAIEDVEYLRNRMMAALKIPKAFLGYEEAVGSKATLAAEDVRFARTIERVQKIVCAELEKIAIVHLYTQGFEDAELINFDLELTNPSMIHEQEKLELLSQQVEIANNIMEQKILSREWVWNNVFDLNDGDKKKIFDELVEDQKQKFRFEQIESEGNDPVDGDTPNSDDEDLEMARSDNWGGDRRTGDGESEKVDTGFDADDLKDATKYKRERNGKRKFKGNSPLATSKGSTLVTREGLLDSLKNKFDRNNKDKSILSEDILINEE
tara:strand:- start:2840 stop:4645 length:1806 start_codon:yes stop_codon:yes gene_type:complete